MYALQVPRRNKLNCIHIPIEYQPKYTMCERWPSTTMNSARVRHTYVVKFLLGHNVQRRTREILNLEAFKIICFGCFICFIWGQSSLLIDGFLDIYTRKQSSKLNPIFGLRIYASFMGEAHFTLIVILITIFVYVCSSICVICFVCSVFTWFNKISKITLKLYMIIHLGISLTACVHAVCIVIIFSIENWHWLLVVTP